MKRRSAGQTEAGFSILEALMSLVIFFLIVSAVLVSYSPSRRLYNRSESQMATQQNVRVALAEMSRSIRMAGYFPENFASPAASPELSDAIRLATDGAIAIYGDADSSGASSVFLFCLNDGMLRRTRAPVDNAAAYTCTSGEILAEDVTSLRFTYYDANNDPIPNPPGSSFQLDSQTPGGVPEMDDTSQRANVRRVVVTVTAEGEDGAGTTGRVEPFTLTSDVVLRNVG